MTGQAVIRAAQALSMAEESSRNYGAFVSLFRQDALAEAATRDCEPSRGPLHGTPIAVKDNIDVAGAWTRYGTPAFGHHRVDQDAEVVSRLRAAGAVVIGKTRMHELAWGMTTPGCRNPHDPTRVTGGSSGGAAAAVAAGAVRIALGTDTGGSIRNPAALCGVAGMKLTPHSLPRDGIASLAPTQDTVGVLAASTSDCRLALEALGAAGSGSTPQRVGLVTNRWAQRVQPEVVAAVDEAATSLRGNELDVVELTIEHSELAPAASYVTMLAEASQQWSRQPPPPAGSLGRDIHGRLLTGGYVTDSDYALALHTGEVIRAAVTAVFEHVDALLLATCPVIAAPIGHTTVHNAGRDIPVETAHSALTSLASVTGLPALSIPARSSSQLPIGLQLIAADTDTLCALASTLEPSTHHTNRTGEGVDPNPLHQ